MSFQDQVNTARAQFEAICPDSCSIVQYAGANDGYGGQTLTGPTTIASGIPCTIESKTEMSPDPVSGTVVRGVRTKIFMKVTANTLAIKPHQQIVVNARAGKAAMTFEDPRLLDRSHEILVTVSAKRRL